MKRSIAGLIVAGLVLAICARGQKVQTAEANSDLRARLVGTWTLVSAKYGGQAASFPEGVVTCKHVTPGGFIWASYKKETGEIYRAGGGTYTLSDNAYTEKVEYGVGDDFAVVKGGEHRFTAKIDGDRWIHSGKLENGITIEEVWRRVLPQKAAQAR